MPTPVASERIRAVAAALTAHHGLPVQVEALPTRAHGQNDLFLARINRSPASAYERVVVRVSDRRRSSNTGNIADVMAWLREREVPAVPIVGAGSLPDGSTYVVMPYLRETLGLGGILGRQGLSSRVHMVSHLQQALHETDTRGWPGKHRTPADELNDLTAAASSGLGVAIATPLIDWLLRHEGDALADDPVVCHLDFHPFNLIWTATDGPYIIDWDSAAVAPRAADVGITAELLCLGAAFIRPAPAGRVAEFIGRRLADAHLRQVGLGASVSAPAVRFWRVAHCAHILLWKAGATVMGLSLSRSECEDWRPCDDARVLRRFAALTR